MRIDNLFQGFLQSEKINVKKIKNKIVTFEIENEKMMAEERQKKKERKKKVQMVSKVGAKSSRLYAIHPNVLY